jgi:hypothetical protein
LDINVIINYVMRTPGNTNPAVLKDLIERYAKENSPDTPTPPTPGGDIVYDGGEEE